MAGEPKNLYELEDYFELTVQGKNYEIDEPINWSNVSIQGNRDKDYYGLNYEFVSEKVTLTFPPGEGMELIESEYKLNGGDAKVQLTYGYIQTGVKKPQFIGFLNLN